MIQGLQATWSPTCTSKESQHVINSPINRAPPFPKKCPQGIMIQGPHRTSYASGARKHRTLQCQFKLISGPGRKRSTGYLGTGGSKFDQKIWSSPAHPGLGPLGARPKLSIDKLALGR
ncbi:hypothetical protein TNCV_1632521 [Trichonephila clavipes]|nr:hypothetical protein TNCV_1632521 [Trichonephila clavipes]